MHDLRNCRFIFTEDTPLKERLMLELILLSYKDITWTHRQNKEPYLKEVKQTTMYRLWIVNSKIYSSVDDYPPYSYLPLLDYKEIIEKY